MPIIRSVVVLPIFKVNGVNLALLAVNRVPEIVEYMGNNPVLSIMAAEVTEFVNFYQAAADLVVKQTGINARSGNMISLSRVITHIGTQVNESHLYYYQFSLTTNAFEAHSKLIGQNGIFCPLNQVTLIAHLDPMAFVMISRLPTEIVQGYK